jgi:hypothetical protein
MLTRPDKLFHHEFYFGGGASTLKLDPGADLQRLCPPPGLKNLREGRISFQDSFGEFVDFAGTGPRKVFSSYLVRAQRKLMSSGNAHRLKKENSNFREDEKDNFFFFAMQEYES